MEPKPAVDLLEHRDFVRAVVRGLLADEHAVDDVVQETCLRALERPPRALRGWLARVGRNLALTALRRDKARGRREHGAARPEGQPSASEAASKLEQHRLVVEAVLGLEEPFRSAILLRFYDDLPPRAIARELGVPVDTVRSRLRRGLERLRAHLDARHGGDRAAWSLALLPLLGGTPSLKVLATGGAVMSAKTKVSVAAVLLCVAAVGTVTWHSTSRATSVPRAAEVEAVRGHGAEIAGATAPPDLTEPEATEQGAKAPATVLAEAEPPKTYRLAESTGDTLGGLRIIARDDAGNGIAGVSVVVGLGVKTATKLTTGPDGRVAIRSLERGRWSVSAFRDGRYRWDFAEVADGRWTEVVIAFARGAEVKGEVRHVERGPLADVGVAIEIGKADDGFSEWFRTSTDAEGRYRLEDVPKGNHPFLVWGGVLGQDQHPRAMLAVPGPGPLNFDILVGRVSLRGTVRDADTGVAVPGARIRVPCPGLQPAETTTRTDGRYEILDLIPGTVKANGTTVVLPYHQVEIEREGYARRTSTIRTVSADGTDTADFTLQRAGVLLIEVLDQEGRPVPGRQNLTLKGGSGSERWFEMDADASGIGRYAGVMPGAYDLVLAVTGYLPRTDRVEVRVGENRLTLRVEAATEQRPISLQGTVLDASTRKPVAGARVLIYRPATASSTDQAETWAGLDGTYRFPELEPGAIAVVATMDDYGRRSLETEIGAEPRTLDIELDPAATLRLHVTDSAGAPVRGKLSLVIVGRDNKTDMGAEVSADADGHAVYRQILPGSYHLLVSQSGVGEGRVDVELALGENVVRLRLE